MTVFLSGGRQGGVGDQTNFPEDRITGWQIDNSVLITLRSTLPVTIFTMRIKYFVSAGLAFPSKAWIVLIFMITCAAIPFREEPDTSGRRRIPPAKTLLIELYTSEGCSSCPAADELLPGFRQPNVYVLEFHVDYWDRLGWKDPFSDPAFSARQKDYAAHFGLSSLYTPEVVINGGSEQVGSDRRAILQAINKEMSDDTGETTSIDLSASKENAVITVKYTAKLNDRREKDRSASIWIALVQAEAISRIGAGENRGRTVKHVNIVRALKNLKSDSGTVSFAIPASVVNEKMTVTGWIQEPGNGTIRAVGSAIPE